MRAALERGLAAQRELQVLLQEQRHRMKNDFATASSLIALQARAQSNLPARAALESAVAKLHVIAETQGHLQITTNDQFVNLQGYVEDICLGLGEALRDVRPIAIRVESEKILLDSRRATHIALKHAFPGDRAGTIQVRLLQRPTDLTIVVEDDGVGCSENVTSGLGTRLVKLLAQQAGGSARQEPANPGCRVVITIPDGLSMKRQQETALS
jgi:two-component sensor histidine kinase